MHLEFIALLRAPAGTGVWLMLVDAGAESDTIARFQKSSVFAS